VDAERPDGPRWFGTPEENEAIRSAHGPELERRAREKLARLGVPSPEEIAEKLAERERIDRLWAAPLPEPIEVRFLREIREGLADLGHEREAASAAKRKAPSQKTASFTHATIQKAVTLFKRHESQNDVVAEAGLDEKNARRVRFMLDGGLFDLNEKGKLWVDERVRRGRRRIVLRYWGDDGRSLDPIVDPP
jgi:hypothetical protein